MRTTWPTPAHQFGLAAAAALSLGGGCASSHEARDVAGAEGELCVTGWLELGHGQSIVARPATPEGPGPGVEIALIDGPGDDRFSAVTTLDVDGDGVRDVVVRNAYGGAAVLDEAISLTIFRGADVAFEHRERVRFTSDVRVPAGGHIAGLGDWDGDARADLVAGWIGSVILTGSEMREGAGPCNQGAAIGDVNADGIGDSACVAPDGVLELVLGGGVPSRAVPRAAPISNVEGAGDVNGDGRSDFAVHFTTGGTELLSGAEPDGAPMATSTDVYTWIALGDVDGDGVADLAAHRSHGAYLVRGSPRGLDIEGEEIISIGDTPRTVSAAGDADCDGFADVFVATGSAIELRRGGAGGIEPTPAWTTTTERRSLVPVYD